MIKKIGLIVIIGLILAGCGVQTQNQGSTTPTATTGMATNTILIENFAFNPAELNIKSGDKVTWINQDSTVHTVVVDGIKSDSLNKGDKFEHTFEATGSYDYKCGIHPSMSGKVIVAK